MIELQRNYTVEMEDRLNILIGCGLTGSNAALLLARSGAKKFLLIDGDRVEGRNLFGQAYRGIHVGMKKVIALEGLIRQVQEDASVIREGINLTKENISEFVDIADNAGLGDPVVYSFADSMVARVQTFRFFEMLRGRCQSIPMLVDTRIGSTFWQLYVLRGYKEKEEYIKTLYSDEDVKEVPACSEGYNLGIVMGCVSEAVREVTFNKGRNEVYSAISVGHEVGDDTGEELEL